MTWLVFTDLDGTLLDHDTYKYDAALGALNELKKAGIAIVIVTSKTRAEVEPLWRELQLKAPFVVENGAAIYAPADSDWVQTDWQRSGAFSVKPLAPTLAEWQPVFEQLAEQFPQQFLRFTQLDHALIAQLTGLSLSDAALAARREFSDPLAWQGDEHGKQAFINAARLMGCDVVSGGRFVHLLKGSDKGIAVKYLVSLAQQKYRLPVRTMALGDGGNDISMLESVNYPVRIRSAHHEFPVVNHTTVFSTQSVGPTGWAEAVRHIILPNLQTEQRG